MNSRAYPTIRLLQIAPRLCWPLDTGAKLRNFHLGRVLSQHAQVTLLAFENENQSPHNLQAVYRQVLPIHRDGHNSFLKMFRGAIGSTPLPLLNYTTRDMKRALQNLLSTQDFDIVQFESIHLMRYLPEIRAANNRALAVLDWHNIESELLQQYAERESRVFRKAYARRTARLLHELEQRAAGEFDAHIVVSEPDAQRLRNLKSDAEILVVENGVDTVGFSQVAGDAQATAPKHRIVFVASMDYHANIDGAIAFAREVWPRVHECKPELIFTIVGRDPATEVRQLRTIPGVEVTGTVDDVRPFYREALAAVVPLRVGGGSRLKVLEAMAMGVPVISTTIGAEGIGVEPGENILVADSHQETQEAIIALAENSDRRAKLIAAGRALVSDRYDWSQVGARLVEHYQRLLREPAAR